jgi:integrase
LEHHPNHRLGTKLLYKRTLARHVYPQLGDRPLAAARRSDIEALVAQLRTSLAPKTVHNIQRLVAAIFNHAVHDGVLAKSPCRGVKLPAPEKRQVTPLTPGQVNSLAETVPERFRALVLLIAGTGMRQGEALGLTLDKIDWLRREVRVERQLVALPKVEPHLGPVKTASSVRTIPLPDFVLQALSAHVGTFDQGPWGLVFTNSVGKPVSRASWHRSWRAAVVAAKVPSATTVHTLRHTYASLLIERGASVKTVQTRLGHASAVETLNTYSHLWPDADDQTRRALDAAFTERADDLLTGLGDQASDLRE